MGGTYIWVLAATALLELALMISVIGSYEVLKKMKEQNDNILSYLDKITSMQQKENEELKKSQIIVTDEEWLCPNCGKINKRYIGTCSCGKSKD